MTTPAWVWGSHLPLLESLIQVVHPELILELGVGRHSTPLFARERQASFTMNFKTSQIPKAIGEFTLVEIV
jgi:hypothetical protein